jgi:hypothetical protein
LNASDPSAYAEFNAAAGQFGTGAFTVSHGFKSSFNLSGYLGDVIHLAYTRQGATVTLYLDGTAIASGSTSSGQATNLTGAYPFRVGRSLGNCCGNFLSLPAAVDDLRIYPTALSASDILELYQAGTP